MPADQLLFSSFRIRGYLQDCYTGGALSLSCRSVEPQDDAYDLGSIHDLLAQARHGATRNDSIIASASISSLTIASQVRTDNTFYSSTITSFDISTHLINIYLSTSARAYSRHFYILISVVLVIASSGSQAKTAAHSTSGTSCFHSIICTSSCIILPTSKSNALIRWKIHTGFSRARKSMVPLQCVAAWSFILSSPRHDFPNTTQRYSTLQPLHSTTQRSPLPSLWR